MQSIDRGTPLAVLTGQHETDGLLPDSTSQKMCCTVISVDNHRVAPPLIFEGRLRNRLNALDQKFVTRPDGSQARMFEGKTYLQVSVSARAADQRVSELLRQDVTMSDTSAQNITAEVCDHIQAPLRKPDNIEQA